MIWQVVASYLSCFQVSTQVNCSAEQMIEVEIHLYSSVLDPDCSSCIGIFPPKHNVPLTRFRRSLDCIRDRGVVGLDSKSGACIIGGEICGRYLPGGLWRLHWLLPFLGEPGSIDLLSFSLLRLRLGCLDSRDLLFLAAHFGSSDCHVEILQTSSTNWHKMN